MLEVIDILTVTAMLAPAIQYTILIVIHQTVGRKCGIPSTSECHALIKKLEFIRRFIRVARHFTIVKNEPPLEFIAKFNMNKFMVYQIIKVMPAK